MNDAVQRFFYRIWHTPCKEAVYDRASGRRYTYGDLGDRANRLAAFLVEERGLSSGDVVALASENRTAFIDAFYASCLTGIVITTYNCLLRSGDIAPLVERERPRIAFVSERHRGVMEDCLRSTGVECELVSLDGDVSDDGRSAYDRIVEGEWGGVAPFFLPTLTSRTRRCSFTRAGRRACRKRPCSASGRCSTTR